MIKLTKQQASKFLIAYQHLGGDKKLSSKDDIMDFINKVGSIQFDPLNVVGRNPDLVLQARVKNYKPEMLESLLYEERKLLDGYDKEMCIYKIEDWPYFDRRRKWHLDYLKNSDRGTPVLKLHPKIKKEVDQLGPVSSKDIELNETVDWAWAPTKLSRAVLESLYHCGELIIHHKNKTRKFYDLSHKHIPEYIYNQSEPNVTDEDYQDWYVKRRVGSVGLLWNKSGSVWLGMFGSKERKSAIERLIKNKIFEEVKIENINTPFFIKTEDLSLLEEVVTSENDTKKSSIIAPLDNLMWDRSMVEHIFDFHYRWEVYKPVHLRKYGYYVLPVLYGDKFVGRFEPSIDKKENTLVVKNWWWEESISVTDELKSSIEKCFDDFLKFSSLDNLVGLNFQ